MRPRRTDARVNHIPDDYGTSLGSHSSLDCRRTPRSARQGCKPCVLAQVTDRGRAVDVEGGEGAILPIKRTGLKPACKATPGGALSYVTENARCCVPTTGCTTSSCSRLAAACCRRVCAKPRRQEWQPGDCPCIVIAPLLGRRLLSRGKEGWARQFGRENSWLSMVPTAPGPLIPTRFAWLPFPPEPVQYTPTQGGPLTFIA
jgi:hypothetical protein